MNGWPPLPKPNPRAPGDFNMEPPDPVEACQWAREEALERLLAQGEPAPTDAQVEELALEIERAAKFDAEYDAAAAREAARDDPYPY